MVNKGEVMNIVIDMYCAITAHVYIRSYPFLFCFFFKLNLVSIGW